MKILNNLNHLFLRLIKQAFKWHLVDNAVQTACGVAVNCLNLRSKLHCETRMVLVNRK